MKVAEMGGAYNIHTEIKHIYKNSSYRT